MTKSPDETCPLCGWSIAATEGGMDGIRVVCKLCGRFTISKNAIATLIREGKELIPYLSCHIRQANKRGEEFIVASHNWREYAMSHKETPFSRRLAKLLDLLAERSNLQPGARFPLDATFDWPLVDTGSDVEFGYLIDFLLAEDYVNKKYDPQYQLNPKAWERFEKAGTGEGMPGKCFVAMSYDDSLKAAYTDGIEVAVRHDCNMDPVRLDLIQHNDKICDRIISDIRGCQFLIADVTLGSENVYFEAGFAMGLDRPVIWSCRHENFDKDVRFDTRQYPYIRWKSPVDLRQQLAVRIKATIRSPALT